ncbi:hypothetical protein CVT26_015503 [Gymnopilus dilepis]|uniref:Uncharacterized protein n=1 Tax=Gymnopilus dilepis TaxID=231916 RepID=A0A409WA21_9AGAR|nr:hypothetical protein CVT26_015503 [Gymnopilus dilepis]
MDADSQLLRDVNRITHLSKLVQQFLRLKSVIQRNQHELCSNTQYQEYFKLAMETLRVSREFMTYNIAMYGGRPLPEGHVQIARDSNDFANDICCITNIIEYATTLRLASVDRQADSDEMKKYLSKLARYQKIISEEKRSYQDHEQQVDWDPRTNFAPETLSPEEALNEQKALLGSYRSQSRNGSHQESAQTQSNTFQGPSAVTPNRMSSFANARGVNITGGEYLTIGGHHYPTGYNGPIEPPRQATGQRNLDMEAFSGMSNSTISEGRFVVTAGNYHDGGRPANNNGQHIRSWSEINQNMGQNANGTGGFAQNFKPIQSHNGNGHIWPQHSYSSEGTIHDDMRSIASVPPAYPQPHPNSNRIDNVYPPTNNTVEPERTSHASSAPATPAPAQQVEQRTEVRTSVGEEHIVTARLGGLNLSYQHASSSNVGFNRSERQEEPSSSNRLADPLVSPPPVAPNNPATNEREDAEDFNKKKKKSGFGWLRRLGSRRVKKDGI